MDTQPRSLIYRGIIIEHIMKHWSVLPLSRQQALTGRVSLRSKHQTVSYL